MKNFILLTQVRFWNFSCKSKIFKQFFCKSNFNALPKYTWKFSNNLTHGNIDITLYNLNSFDAFQINGFSAQTLNDKRLTYFLENKKILI